MMIENRTRIKREKAEKLRETVAEARKLAQKLGLDPYPVKYWVVDYDEMNELIAYNGFQTRYPHWRWGMQYDQQRKKGQYAGGKIYELVINDNPAHAYLQESNELADQKGVITHVEAHSDFFANNTWFSRFGIGDEKQIHAARMLERNARRIEDYMQETDIDREEVEEWIDNILCLEDNIDQHAGIKKVGERDEEDGRDELEEMAEKLDEMDLSDEVKREVFSDRWLDEQREKAEEKALIDKPEKDLLYFLRMYGKQYDEESGKAVEMEEWQKEVIDMLRKESYYFAPQKMTKVMNEGFASFFESLMMGEENFAESNEFIDYAEHLSRVLGSSGLNPYKLGKEMWEYIENKENRTEVVKKLLRVKGINVDNFFEEVDFERVEELLEPEYPLNDITNETLEHLRDIDPEKVDEENLEHALEGEIDAERYPWKVLSYEGLAERHFSLNKLQNRGFVENISRSELEEIGRYLINDDVYDSVEEAINDVDYTVGWDRMYEIRETHNDVTFLDEFLTQEFVNQNNYFTYEYSHATGDYRVTSTEYEDVKKKLLLQFTNFGKPTIKVQDGNYNNRGELLLAHYYNGVMLNIQKAKRTLERIHKMWGRPVNLKTIIKTVDERKLERARRRGKEPEPEEQGLLIRYDGENFERRELDWKDVEDIAATDIDYDTKPDEWLS
ncbi:MAG: SpoVR family protein [Halobacteria archaeon]|nr:SpoVR family protein [Halobacteria archaeon]